MYKLSSSSRQKLIGVHSDLVKVVERAIEITTVDFTVLEGPRTYERQQQLFDAGSSWTMNSRHLRTKGPKEDIPTAKAVDLGAWVDGEVSWAWPPYYEIARAMKTAAKELGIPIEWGGDWNGEEADGPHYQLPWKEYR
jgi:peptidoglycan L-alanyl-D-glutamate endopeptidase CwlK